MAFFAESTYEESYQDLGIVVNDYTDFDTLALEACDVIEEMNNAILYGIGHYELDMIREGAEVVVYTEGMLDSIKNKITGIWNKFIAYIESYIRGDKEFLQKYDKQLKENLNYLDKDFKKTYKYASMISHPGMLTDDVIKSNKRVSEELLKLLEKNENKIKDDDLYKKYLDGVCYKFSIILAQKEKMFIQASGEEDVDSRWIKKNFNNIKNTLLIDIPKLKKILNETSKSSVEVFEKHVIKL